MKYILVVCFLLLMGCKTVVPDITEVFVYYPLNSSNMVYTIYSVHTQTYQSLQKTNTCDFQHIEMAMRQHMPTICLPLHYENE